VVGAQQNCTTQDTWGGIHEVDPTHVSYIVQSCYAKIFFLRNILFAQLLHNNCTTMLMSPAFFFKKMLDLQHQYNNCTTTPHMKVGPTHWSPPSCEELLCSCCISVVQESNPFFFKKNNKMKMPSTLLCNCCAANLSQLLNHIYIYTHTHTRVLPIIIYFKEEFISS
jgi:hypothetical protein